MKPPDIAKVLYDADINGALSRDLFHDNTQPRRRQ